MSLITRILAKPNVNPQASHDVVQHEPMRPISPKSRKIHCRAKDDINAQLRYLPAADAAPSFVEPGRFHHVVTIRYVEHHAPGEVAPDRPAPRVSSVRTTSGAWPAWLARRLRRRHVGQAAKPMARPFAGQPSAYILRPYEGFVVRQWPLPGLPAADRRVLVDEPLAWLSHKLEQMPSRSTMRRCQVVLALITRHGGRRALIWQATLVPFLPQEWPKALRAVRDQLASLPLTAHPQASRLEVSVVEISRERTSRFTAMDV